MESWSSITARLLSTVPITGLTWMIMENAVVAAITIEKIMVPEAILAEEEITVEEEEITVAEEVVVTTEIIITGILKKDIE